MEFNKISLTLFDVISYLLPGSVILFGLSVIEATFFPSDLLSISSIQENWLITSIIAYFLGQFSYRLASYAHNTWPTLFENRKLRLAGSIYNHVRDLLNDMYAIKFKEGERFHSLETYLLADSYVVASDKTAERDSLIAREGFYKNSMVAFAFLTVVVLVSLLNGGSKIQYASNSYYIFTIIGSIVVSIFLLIMTLVFWQGFVYFNRVKINNTLILAMTLRTLDLEGVIEKSCDL